MPVYSSFKYKFVSGRYEKCVSTQSEGPRKPSMRAAKSASVHPWTRFSERYKTSSYSFNKGTVNTAVILPARARFTSTYDAPVRLLTAATRTHVSRTSGPTHYDIVPDITARILLKKRLADTSLVVLGSLRIAVHRDFQLKNCTYRQETGRGGECRASQSTWLLL